MLNRFLINLSLVLVVACSAVRPSHADIFYYENFAAWQSAVSGSIQTLDLYNANAVALATEVASPPSDNDLLGTSVLTFESANTGFVQDFQLGLLESTDFQYQDSGSRLGLEPSSSGQEDFEQNIGGLGTFALGMELAEHQAINTVWEFFDADNNSLGSVTLSDGGVGSMFYGIVSDTSIARAVVTHSANENFGIGTQYFSTASAIPEPGSLVVLMCALVGGCTLQRRRTRA